MSDKPKPGKDKDSRSLRQAVAATHALLEILAAEAAQSQVDGYARQFAHALLVVAEQLDHLDRLSDDVACAPHFLLEQNRQLRMILRGLLQADAPVRGVALVQMTEAVAKQLQALLVVKEIRSASEPSLPNPR